MSVISDLLTTLSKLRKVKYGDIVLSSDHNNLVDVVNKLLELYLPSKIDPTKFIYTPVIFHNFIDSPCTGWYYSCACAVSEPSKCVVSHRWSGFNVASIDGVSLCDFNGKIAICVRFIKSQPLEKTYCDVPTVDVYIDENNGMYHMSPCFRYYYCYCNDKVIDKLVIIDEASGNSFEIEPIPIDWTVLLIDFFAREAKVLDRNGNCLGSISFMAQSTDEKFFEIIIATPIELGISPNKLEIDWIVY